MVPGFFIVMIINCGCDVSFIVPIVAPNAVEKFLQPECVKKTSQNVEVTFHWVVSSSG